jgi:hypothetical protein
MQPRLAVFVGAQLFPHKEPVVGAGVRLFGQLWLEGWVRQPIALASPAAGAQLRLAF